MGVLDGRVAIIIVAMMGGSGGSGIGGATAQLMAREVASADFLSLAASRSGKS